MDPDEEKRLSDLANQDQQDAAAIEKQHAETLKRLGFESWAQAMASQLGYYRKQLLAQEIDPKEVDYMVREYHKLLMDYSKGLV